MQTFVVQALALTNWGNSYLRNKVDVSENENFLNNSTFASSKAIEFLNPYAPNLNTIEIEDADGEIIHELIPTPNPVAWLQELKEQGYTGLKLFYLPPEDVPTTEIRMQAAFAGGERLWFIAGIKDNYSDVWDPIWDLRYPDEEQIWHVTYEAARPLEYSVNPPSLNNQLNECYDLLEKALIYIRDFAAEQNLNDYEQVFQEALNALHDDNIIDNPFCHIIAHPEDLLPKALQIMCAIQRAWVFGAMGSWNDLYFENEEVHARYQEISDILWTECCLGLADAANFGLKKAPFVIANDETITQPS